MTKSIRFINLLLALILLLIAFALPIVLYQRMADSNRQLIKQNAELQQNIDSLKEQIKVLNTQINTSRAPEEQKKKNGRGGERLAFNLTPSERDLVEQVVMAEAGGEPYEGQMLVAQCILDACEIDGIRPAEVVEKYVYAKSRPEPSDSVIKAVSAVFDKGKTLTDEPIVYFYAPARVHSDFHESQRFICEVGGHRFFAGAN